MCIKSTYTRLLTCPGDRKILVKSARRRRRSGRRRDQLHLEDQGTLNSPNPSRTWWRRWWWWWWWWWWCWDYYRSCVWVLESTFGALINIEHEKFPECSPSHSWTVSRCPSPFTIHSSRHYPVPFCRTLHTGGQRTSEWVDLWMCGYKVKHQIALKSVHRKPRSSMRKDGRTDMKITFALRNFAKAPKNQGLWARLSRMWHVCNFGRKTSMESLTQA